MTYKNTIPMQNWSDDDRPDTKLLLKGKNALSDAELLSVIIGGTGIKQSDSLDAARLLLSMNENSLAGLAKMNYQELCNAVSAKVATRIICPIELGKRRNELSSFPKDKISHSRDAYEMFRSKMQDKPYEEFWMLLINRGNKVISLVQVSEGGISGTVVDPKKIFKIALDNHASSIILGHNHPSGFSVPGDADIKITNKVKEAGVMLDIAVIDHLIIGDKTFYSFAD